LLSSFETVVEALTQSCKFDKVCLLRKCFDLPRDSTHCKTAIIFYGVHVTSLVFLSLFLDTHWLAQKKV